MNILIVEDDKVLNDGIRFNLEIEGFKVECAYKIREAKEKIANNFIDLIILDIDLPDGNGFEFCKEIRADFKGSIMFLTACDMEYDVIKGFRLGGDDYITKPFNLNIFKERVQALLRRVNRNLDKDNFLHIDGFQFDLNNMLVSKNNKNILLAPTEYRILKKIAISKGQILTRDELISEIWESGEYIEEHTLTVNINRIRRKINDFDNNYIKTVYGIGYMWVCNDK